MLSTLCFLIVKVGQPAPGMLPLEEIREAMCSRLKQTNPLLLQYGSIPGYTEFRESLANFLSKEYAADVIPDDLFITGGVTGALQFICTFYTSPGDLIFAEDPTYFLAKRIFEDFKLNVVQIPMEKDGLDISKIEPMILDHGVPKFFYTIPVAQNPTGRTMSMTKKIGLVQLAKKYDFQIIADEVYQLLTFPNSQRPPLPMFYFDDSPQKDRVFSISSFSKILAPALRCGWIHASKSLLEPIYKCGILDSSGGNNPLSSACIHEAILMGLQKEILERNRTELQNRCQTLINAIEKFLVPLGCSYETPLGGYFVLLKLPPGVHSQKLHSFCQAYKVNFLPGTTFGASYDEFVRLSFSYYPAASITSGIHRLASSISDFKKEEL